MKKRVISTLIAILGLFILCGSSIAQEPSKQTPSTNAEPPAAKNYFTDVLLVNQNGEKMRFYSDLLQGKVVVINSFFATCTGSCLPLNRNLEKLQKALGEHMGKEVYSFPSASIRPLIRRRV